MATKFNQCPNCKRGPIRNIILKESRTIFECRACGTLYCYDCGESRCPDCGKRDRNKVGYVPAG
jgi:hypothetical protein